MLIVRGEATHLTQLVSLMFMDREAWAALFGTDTPYPEKAVAVCFRNTIKPKLEIYFEPNVLSSLQFLKTLPERILSLGDHLKLMELLKGKAEDQFELLIDGQPAQLSELMEPNNSSASLTWRQAKAGVISKALNLNLTSNCPHAGQLLMTALRVHLLGLQIATESIFSINLSMQGNSFAISIQLFPAANPELIKSTVERLALLSRMSVSSHVDRLLVASLHDDSLVKPRAWYLVAEQGDRLSVLASLLHRNSLQYFKTPQEAPQSTLGIVNRRLGFDLAVTFVYYFTVNHDELDWYDLGENVLLGHGGPELIGIKVTARKEKLVVELLLGPILESDWSASLERTTRKLFGRMVVGTLNHISVCPTLELSPTAVTVASNSGGIELLFALHSLPLLKAEMLQGQPLLIGNLDLSHDTPPAMQSSYVIPKLNGLVGLLSLRKAWSDIPNHALLLRTAAGEVCISSTEQLFEVPVNVCTLAIIYQEMECLFPSDSNLISFEFDDGALKAFLNEKEAFGFGLFSYVQTRSHVELIVNGLSAQQFVLELHAFSNLLHLDRVLNMRLSYVKDEIKIQLEVAKHFNPSAAIRLILQALLARGLPLPQVSLDGQCISSTDLVLPQVSFEPKSSVASFIQPIAFATHKWAVYEAFDDGIMYRLDDLENILRLDELYPRINPLFEANLGADGIPLLIIDEQAMVNLYLSDMLYALHIQVTRFRNLKLIIDCVKATTLRIVGFELVWSTKDLRMKILGINMEALQAFSRVLMSHGVECENNIELTPQPIIGATKPGEQEHAFEWRTIDGQLIEFPVQIPSKDSRLFRALLFTPPPGHLSYLQSSDANLDLFPHLEIACRTVQEAAAIFDLIVTKTLSF